MDGALSNSLMAMQTMVAQLENAKESVESLIDKMPGYFYIISASGNVLKANHDGATLLNRTVESVIGQSISKLLTKKYWRLVSTKLVGEASNWEKMSFVIPVQGLSDIRASGSGGVLHWEFDYFNGYGAHSEPMFVAYAHDVSEQRKLQTRINHIFDYAPLGIFSVNRNGLISDLVSGYFSRLFNGKVTIDNDVYSTIFLMKEDGSCHVNSAKDKFYHYLNDKSTECPSAKELILDIVYPPYAFGNKEICYYRMTFSPIMEEGTFQGLLGIVQDQTEIYEEKIKHQEEKLLARKDALTSIYNRLALEESALQIVAQCRKDSCPLSVLFIDIDDFKRYNDHYGHAAGDECLVRISDIIGGALRKESDFLARYGGEEFVILLPDTDVVGAKIIAERARQLVENTRIEHVSSKYGEIVTISIGVVTQNVCQLKKEDPPPLSFKDIKAIKLADEGVYIAKSKGRNRVVYIDYH
ncbi:MAG: diguanylate cyclase (GGDEF)-like protein [Cellvibrionaceae bacterium]|jgi:diguanylate cyclase (GGDEF)-like protein